MMDLHSKSFELGNPGIDGLRKMNIEIIENLLNIGDLAYFAVNKIVITCLWLSKMLLFM